MSIEFLLLIVLALCYTYFENKIYKTHMSPTTILVWPYVIVVFAIQTIGQRFGCYNITPNNIHFICLGSGCFFCGSVVSRFFKEKLGLRFKKEFAKRSLITNTTVCNGVKYVILVEIVIALRYLIVFFRYGLGNYIATSGYDGIIATGFCAHLMFSIFPLIPLLLYEAIKRKNIKLAGVVLFAYIEVFFTYTKYHIILLVIASLMYLVIVDREQIKMVLPLIAVIPVAIFFFNYIVNFKYQGAVANWNFLWKHFFNYLLGGVAYTSIAPESISVSGLTFFDIVFSQIRTIPNLFSNGLFDYVIGKPLNIPTIQMSSTGERGNVVSVLCLVYATKNYVAASIYLFILGVLTSFVVNLTKQVLLKTYLLSIVFLSFYSSYFQLVAPWEICIFSVLLPYVLTRKIVVGNKKLM